MIEVDPRGRAVCGEGGGEEGASEAVCFWMVVISAG